MLGMQHSVPLLLHCSLLGDLGFRPEPVLQAAGLEQGGSSPATDLGHAALDDAHQSAAPLTPFSHFPVDLGFRPSTPDLAAGGRHRGTPISVSGGTTLAPASGLSQHDGTRPVPSSLGPVGFWCLSPLGSGSTAQGQIAQGQGVCPPLQSVVAADPGERAPIAGHNDEGLRPGFGGEGAGPEVEASASKGGASQSKVQSLAGAQFLEGNPKEGAWNALR